MANINVTKTPIKFGTSLTSIQSVENEIIFGFNSDIIGSTSFHTFLFRVQSPILDSDTFTLNGQTFTAKDTAQFSREFRTTTVTTLQQVTEDIFFLLQENPIFKNVYDFFYDPVANPDRFLVKAKFKGSKFNTTLTSTTANIFKDININGSDKYRGQQLFNWGVFVNIRSADKVFWLNKLTDQHTRQFGSLLLTLEKKWLGLDSSDNEKRIDFDISSVLKTFLKTDPPNFTSSTIISTTNQLIHYYLEYGEFFSETSDGFIRKRLLGSIGFPVDNNKNTFEDNYWGHNSSFPLTQVQNITGSNLSLYWDRSITPLRLLTRQPSDKQYIISQQEFLYFFYTKSDSEKNITKRLTSRFDLTFEDGSLISLFASTTTISSSITGNVFYYRVSAMTNQLINQEQIAGRRIKYFDVFIIEHNTALDAAVGVELYQSQRYRMNNVDRCKETFATLLFLNSLGGFDSIAGSGEYIKSFETSNFKFEKNIDLLKPRSEMTDIGVKNIENTILYQFNASNLDQIHQEWLKELLVSTEIYIIIPNDTSIPGGVRRSIIKKHNWILNTMNNTYDLTIDLEIAIEENQITQ